MELRYSDMNDSTIEYYKDLYSGHKIIYVRFLDEDFIFRTLTRKEYKTIKSRSYSKYDYEDTICNVSCIYPEGYDFSQCGFAGLPEYVAEVVEYLSGFKDIQTVLNVYKQEKEQVTLELQAMDLIKAFIPEYTYEEMADWTWEKLMKMTVRAENVAKLKGFDWHLEDKSEEYQKAYEQVNSDNREFITKLYENGVDPMFYFEDELKKLFIRDVVDFPIISSGKWNNEEVLNVIRKQSSNIRR